MRLTRERFLDLLVKYTLVHPDAIDDPEGWDGGATRSCAHEMFDEVEEGEVEKPLDPVPVR